MDGGGFVGELFEFGGGLSVRVFRGVEEEHFSAAGDGDLLAVRVVLDVFDVEAGGVGSVVSEGVLLV